MKGSFITFLKQVNAMPFPFSMKHYQIFGDTTSALKDQELNSAESWDALRENHSFFSISSNREEWVAASELAVQKDGQDRELKDRAHAIAALVTDHRFDKIFSVGVGGAALEYQLKKLMPGIPLVCSDYSETTVERLKKVFIESDGVVRFDIVKGDWGEAVRRYLGVNGLCIMYRLDAGFSDQEWNGIFQSLQDAGVRNVLVIPTGTLTLLSIYNRKKREVGWFFNKIPVVFSGYLRTKQQFLKQWNEWYASTELTLGGLTSFLLTKKEASR